jgi:nucleoside-diphosphate-sugar epimerase
MNGHEVFQAPDLGPVSDWAELLTGVSVIIHCAARAHIMSDPSADPLNEFRSVNVEGTLNLARQAAKSGVKRFIFLIAIAYTILSKAWTLNALSIARGFRRIALVKLSFVMLVRQTG